MLRLVIVMVLLSCNVTLAAEGPLADVPARKDGKLLFVPVRINGVGPFWFCVDSGASHTVIDPRLARKLGLEASGRGKTTGTGQGDVAVGKLPPVTLDLGGVLTRIEEPWLIDLSGVPIPQWTEGLVGVEIFEKHIVEMDSEKPALRLHDPQRYAARRDASSIPLIVREHKLYLPATITPREGKSVERELRIDSGSEESVADVLVKEGAETRSSTLGQGLGANFQGVSGLLHSVRIGRYTFQRVWGPESQRPAIGMELLRRFLVVFDAPHGKLHLVPNSHLADPVPEPPA